MASQEFLDAALRARLARAGIAPATDVGVAPAIDVGVAPATDVGVAPATDVGVAPATDVGVTPATDVGPVGPGDAEDALVAVAVLRRFDPPRLAESARRFSMQLPPAQAEPWLQAFTRTIFLAGNPANLRHRFAFTEIAADASIAWCGPAPAREFTGLRRLLKLYPAGQLAVAHRVRLPGGDPGVADPRRLVIATAGLTIADYLVHLNHTLAEAVLTGLLRAGDRLLLEHVPDIDDAVLESAEAIRVHRDLADPHRLRAYACLTPGTAQPEQHR